MGKRQGRTIHFQYVILSMGKLLYLTVEIVSSIIYVHFIILELCLNSFLHASNDKLGTVLCHLQTLI